MLFVFQRTAGRPTWRIEKCAGPGKRGEQQRIGLGPWHRQPFHQHRNPFLRPSPPSECIGKPPTRKQVAWCEAQNPPVMGSRGFPLTTGIVCVAVGFLPTQVNRRNQVTDVVSTALGILSRKTTVPVLPEIRTDQTVHKAARARQFLIDYDPKCKAAEDYQKAFEVITASIAIEEPHAEPAQA